MQKEIKERKCTVPTLHYTSVSQVKNQRQRSQGKSPYKIESRKSKIEHKSIEIGTVYGLGVHRSLHHPTHPPLLATPRPQFKVEVE